MGEYRTIVGGWQVERMPSGPGITIERVINYPRNVFDGVPVDIKVVPSRRTVSHKWLAVAIAVFLAAFLAFCVWGLVRELLK